MVNLFLVAYIEYSLNSVRSMCWLSSLIKHCLLPLADVLCYQSLLWQHGIRCLPFHNTWHPNALLTGIVLVSSSQTDTYNSVSQRLFFVHRIVWSYLHFFPEQKLKKFSIVFILFYFILGNQSTKLFCRHTNKSFFFFF